MRPLAIAHFFALPHVRSNDVLYCSTDLVPLSQQLDREIREWRQHLFAESTRNCYKSHVKIYLRFCELLKCQPIPINPQNVCRYAAYLGRTRSFATVQQYLNVIRILHLEVGMHNPLIENWQLSSLLKSMKRKKSSTQNYKLPLTPDHLLGIRRHLNLEDTRDSQFWCTILSCFFGLLRISSVTVSSGKPSKQFLKRRNKMAHIISKTETS